MALSHTNVRAAGTSEAGGATIRTGQPQDVATPREAIRQLMPLVEDLKLAADAEPTSVSWTRIEPTWREAFQLLGRFGQLFGADPVAVYGRPTQGYT